MEAREVLEKVKNNEISIEEAEKYFKKEPFEEMGYAKLDTHREIRSGFAEVIFCARKADEHLLKIFTRLYEQDGEVFGTRASEHQYELIREKFPEVVYDPLSHILKIEKKDKKKIVKEVINQNGNSPLLQTRFLRNGFENDFEELVREILYKNAVESSDLLEEIGQLCIPNRGKLGVRAIINYNFDDLVEKNLKRLRVKYHSIYGEGMIPDADELGIYHVHGFLPQEKENYENLTKSLLVFSEEGYHKLMLEPYNWANISQLNYMINNTCLFIGLSMTDPNMRRLLEIAAQKRIENDSDCQHYAIMRRFRMKESAEVDSIKSFERVNETLQESFFKELGVNVIWIDEFSEIPAILKQIKGNYESY